MEQSPISLGNIINEKGMGRLCAGALGQAFMVAALMGVPSWNTKREKIMEGCMVSEMDDTALQSYGDGLGAVAGGELGKDVFDMRLHGVLGDVEDGCDILVGSTAGKLVKHLNLALAEFLAQRAVRQAAGDFRRDPLSAPHDRPDGGDEFFAG